ncbi:hypothetical protein ACO2RV_24960, partial [Ancylobacter sp. VNQ12]|uniref:hypothetical protein n=1 Tax=Ancylobacter sp. VNQ12 TaxID=3400920 RepID=UPI003C0D6713
MLSSTDVLLSISVLMSARAAALDWATCPRARRFWPDAAGPFRDREVASVGRSKSDGSGMVTGEVPPPWPCLRQASSVEMATVGLKEPADEIHHDAHARNVA